MTADGPPRLIERADLDFMLYDLIGLEELTGRLRFEGQDRAAYDAILDQAETIAWEKFRNHLQKSDREEPRLEDGAVRLPPEIAEGVAAFHAAGFAAAHHDAEIGGLQLPWTVAQAAFAYFQAANIGTVAYPFLTIAAANLIAAYGSADQKSRFLPPMLEGRFFGTMALSEPQAGSSLGDIRTKAVPQADGRYAIKGSKMWISGGDHGMAETIVHLLLARIEGAPEGVKGLSLFIVPRDRVDETGAVGAPNGVTLTGLNHKMGYRGTVNTALSLGDNDGCIGELVGAPNTGLAQMFHMMNEARIGVGAGAAMLAYAGYRESLSYAQERRQGRALSAKGPEAGPARLIAHPDVRRMLIEQKVVAEGGLALALFCARLVDEKATAFDPGEQRDSHLLLELLTPVLKAWFSDAALRANDAAIQIHGGYGYTRDFLVEQLYRDNRLNPIHEGTNGVQALDLLGRKAFIEDGAALSLLGRRIVETARIAPEALKSEADALLNAWGALRATTLSIGARREKLGPEVSLAPAQAYMEAFGRITLAWIWLWQAVAVGNHSDPQFRAGKLAACRHTFFWELPKAFTALAQIDAQEDAFGGEPPYPDAEIF